MTLRSACVLLLLVTTAFSQDAQYAYGPVSFGPFPKHKLAVRDGLRIVLHGMPSGADWVMGVKTGKSATAEITKALVGPALSIRKDPAAPDIQIPMKTVLDMQESKNVRITDGLIEINGLDALKDYTPVINLTVPAGTNVTVQNDSDELFDGRADGTLTVKNGMALPGIPKTVPNVLVALTLP
jgi:hypothetical protein